MSDRNVIIGRFTIFAIGLAFMLIGAVFWLGVIDLLSLQTAALWFFAVPLVGLLILVFLGGVSTSNEPVFGKVGAEALVLLALLLVDAWLWGAITNQGSVLDPFALGITAIEGVLLVGILFAIFEETFFTTIAAFFKRAGTPDLIVIAINMIVFVLLHARAYPDQLFFSLWLSFSRAMLTGALVKLNNSDVPFLAHIGYNAIVTLMMFLG